MLVTKIIDAKVHQYETHVGVMTHILAHRTLKLRYISMSDNLTALHSPLITMMIFYILQISVSSIGPNI